MEGEGELIAGGLREENVTHAKAERRKSARQAQARNLAVAVTKQDDYVTLVVQDDGKGFDVKQIVASKPATRRIGLVAMEERTRMTGGTPEIWSQEDSGTYVIFNIPIKGQIDEAVAS